MGEMEKGMEEQSLVKFGRDMLQVIENVPSWMELPQVRLLKYAEVKRSEKRREVDSFLMLYSNCVVVCDVYKSLVKSRAAANNSASVIEQAASVGVPLGSKGSEALRKHWKFLSHFSRAVAKITVVNDCTMTVGTQDTDTVTLQFATGAELKEWPVEL